MTKRKGCMTFSVIGFLFVFCCMSGYELAEKGNIVWNSTWMLKLFSVSILGGSILGSLLCLLFLKLEERHTEKETAHKLPGPGVLFGLSWLCTMLCWLPGYLAYYPGICAYDFTIQLGQITSHQYNDHHPLFHTLLMELFYHIGEWLGDATSGVALYTFFQMSLLAAALAGGIAMLRRKQVRDGLLILLQITACIFPFHWYMSITATKDTIFTAFMILQLLMLCGLIEEKENRLCFSLWDIGYLCCSVFMILFRNNGRYAMMVPAAFLFLAVLFGKKARKLWMKLLGETLAGILVGSILLSAVFNWTGALQGDRREMLSMPIQQLARCMIYHGGVDVLEEDDNTMSETDKALVNEFILNEAYKEYRADIADPVKKNTNTYVFVYKMKDFLTTYLSLFTQYPGDYINAVLAVNAGYLYPWDESHAYINVNGRDTGLGYIQTRWLEEEISPAGIERDSKWEWLKNKLEYFADANMHLEIPILKYLLVPGTYVWLYLVLAAWIILHKKYRLLLPLSLILGYYVTLFLGPTVQLRYIYPVMTALPYLVIWLLHDMKERLL